MTEGIDTVLGIRGDIVYYFKGYLKADMLVAIDAVVHDLCSFRRVGCVISFVDYLQEG